MTKADGKVCVGIVLAGQDIQIAVRTGGLEVAQASFPAGPLGRAALLMYLTDWQAPLRLAVAGVGAAALTLALAVGAQHDREVYLVSGHAPPAVSDLARYAQRAI
jgi:hypothetical protein